MNDTGHNPLRVLCCEFLLCKTREANVVCGYIHTGNENVFCTSIFDISQNRHKAFSLALQGNYCTLCSRKVRQEKESDMIFQEDDSAILGHQT